LNITEGSDSVSIYYDYVKSDSVITIAQLCKIKDEKIIEILCPLEKAKRYPMPINPTGRFIALADQGNYRILLYSQPEILRLLESRVQ